MVYYIIMYMQTINSTIIEKKYFLVKKGKSELEEENNH